MADAPTSLDWDTVHAQERETIREPDGRHEGPDRPLTGLAFSGGGIRSATFNLGVVQALAELKLLRQFDYLSCVSGGGYIGGWLSAFIHRHNGRVEDAEPQLHTGGAENAAIRFLRSYSNYLTPKASFFSADTLTAVATYFRNLYLNLTLLLLALGGLLLLPRLLVWFVRWLTGWEGAHPAVHANLIPLFGGGILCIFIAMLFVGLNLGSRGASFSKAPPFYTRQAGVLLLVVLPALLSAWLIAYGFYAGADKLNRISLGGWVLWGLLVYVPPWLAGWVLGRFLIRRRRNHANFTPRRLAAMTVYALLAGALGGLLLAAFAEIAQFILEAGQGYSGSWIASALATALLLKFYSLAVVGHIGLMGRYFSHDSREWWARLGGWVLLVSLVWAAVFSIVYVAPAFFRWAPEAFVAAGGATWAVSTVAGVLLGRSAKTAGHAKTWRDRLAPVMPYVFVIGLLGLLSLGLHQLLMLPVFCDGCVRHADGQAGFIQALAQEAPNFRRPDIAWVAVLCAGSLAAAAALAGRIDVNLFAIYHFYRQRLVRCYLGASRCKERTPHPFTGFDPRDDLRLAELCLPLGEPQCQRPYLIHNTAMNLVAGKQLAWQERRAAAFAFTPLASGYSFTLPDEQGRLLSHYRPTAQYMEGVWMGSAMAISGAAASPNMGYHSSPALTFLMTVFNVRLGHWSPNPANEKSWTLHDPPFGGTYLLKELFGHTQHTSPFVYLSDGGHFENLGLYELVRRRCACIVAIDAGQDGKSQFDDLGNAIRKCYADFGVSIDIHAEDMKDGYYAIGRVIYPPPEGSSAPPSEGHLIYLKPRLTGSEPADLLNYKCTHPGFPHESTADQWFDESQFESYRKLGHHIGRSVFSMALAKASQRQKEAGDAGPILPWLCAILRERRVEAA